jgi:hypothetical protein
MLTINVEKIDNNNLLNIKHNVNIYLLLIK